MKHTGFCLLLGLLLLFCCTAAAEDPQPPMPTPIPHLQTFFADQLLYYNPNGGTKYHLDPYCPSVSQTYLPLAGTCMYFELNDAAYADLQHCVICGAPLRPAAAALPVIDMPAGNDYLPVDFGVTTWRGSSFRANAASGKLRSAPTGLEIAWKVNTAVPSASDHIHAGFDWYSQPAIVQWPVEIREASALSEEARRTRALKEVIFASLDGNIYFLDLADGTATREPLRSGTPMLSAVTLHPVSYPLLWVGQYADASTPASQSVGLQWFSLQTMQELNYFSGKQADGLIGAFNTSALIDHTTNTAVALSKDGYLYAAPLDVTFLATSSHPLTMLSDIGAPVWVKLTNEGEQVTTAPVMYGSRLWFGTSQGRILCIDTADMQQVWSCPIGDGPIYTLAMEEDADGQLWLYTGEAAARRPDMPLHLCRIHADTGDMDWSVQVGQSTSMSYSGAVAACAVGEHELDGLVFYALSSLQWTSGDMPSKLIAIDKSSGEIVWQQGLTGECKSAPVAVYTDDGRGWVIQTNSIGEMHLYDGLTGSEVAALQLEGDRWSSPAVLDGMLVIGSCTYTEQLPFDAHIWGIRIVCDAPAASSAALEPTAVPSARSRLEDFLSAWNRNDRDDMLALCSPDWKAEQANPDAALFMLLMNRTALAWAITELPTENDQRCFDALVLLDANNGRSPMEYRFTFRMTLHNSLYYVEPESLAHGKLVN